VDASAQLEGKPSMMNPRISNSKSEILNSRVRGQNLSSQDSNSKSQAVQKVTFGVSGNCGMCKDRIEKAAKSVKGVSSAVWSMKTKKITVEYNSSLASINDIQMAIAKVGHNTDKYKADDKVYNFLPECCKYRK